MADQIITNPASAGVSVTDFRTGVDASGFGLSLPRQVDGYRANDTILATQAVAIIAPTATVPASVELLDVSDAFASLVYIGVAVDSAVAGEIVQVCTKGVCIVSIDDGAPIYGDVAIKHATVDGALISAGTAGGTWDASDVQGTACGIFLGAEIGTGNTALLYVCKF